MEEDELVISQILQQAPVEIGYEEAKKAYYKACRDVSTAVAELWKLPPLLEKSKKVGVDADKWDEIRNLCDEFDAEATRSLAEMMKHSRQQQAQSVSIEECVNPK